MTTHWLDVPDDDPFSLANLPYGSGILPSGEPAALVRIGPYALDLTRAFAGLPSAATFAAGTLDALLAAGPAQWAAVRGQIVEWLTDDAHRARLEPLIVPLADVRMQLPFTVADYVDFYASVHHATNVGRLFRPDSEPLPSNWRRLPIGYHGRAGTVVVSGTDVVRPRGQSLVDGDVIFGPSARLDFEAEVGFVVGSPSLPGRPVPAADLRAHVFGVTLLNDWSARDIQAWESVPLGPFLGKSFGTSISPWITPLAALDDAWRPTPTQSPVPQPYLADGAQNTALEIALEVALNGEVISRPPFAEMYWTPAQMLAHMTVNGAQLRTGDLFASGTVSGARADQLGCLLELTSNGTQPLTLADGSRRAFLDDGDTITISGSVPGPAGPLGLGEVRGQVVAATS